MAAEDDFAEYVQRVLYRLLEVAALGAVIWCFADYHPDLHDLPPCDESCHERFFGLVRPDGSLKPHAEVIRKFASENPLVQPASRKVQLGMSPKAYYQISLENALRLYQTFIG